ncbi:MAG: chlorite dismutase family protein [Acidobacteriota bacterium]|nr:chlorite dismutase family protein [Acidobacteriota bacterium]
MTEHKHPEAAATTGEDRRQFVNFGCYKVDPAWRRLPEEERKRGKAEFFAVVNSYEKEVMTIAYSMIGVRGDCDFMLWRIGYDLLKFQEMMAKLLETGLGNYLTTPYSFLSMTKRSVYVDKHTHIGQEGTRLKLIPGQFKFLFVYPFVKSKAWYRLTKHARQGMMDEHIEIGHRYPTVRLNTTYSFGLDDQEFVVAFESDKPEHFVDLVMELRHSEATSYTVRDTPTLTGIHRELDEVLDLLGG